jgi:hypothetical protein
MTNLMLSNTLCFLTPFVHSSNHHRPSFQSLFVSQVYAILDEVFLAGEIEETSKEVVLARLEELEKLE